MKLKYLKKWFLNKKKTALKDLKIQKSEIDSLKEKLNQSQKEKADLNKKLKNAEAEAKRWVGILI